MANPGTPTIDQLRVFIEAVDGGSFASASRKLNRAVSVISYTIAGLEEQPGFPLFERERTRKPVLTPAGRTMLAEARVIIKDVDSLRAKAKGVLEGLKQKSIWRST
jgi:DNA-binding transcriptional LysR family regulator